MSAQLALLPTGRFWVVRLGTGPAHGPFVTERAAERFAAASGRPASNFIIPVLLPSERDGERHG